MNLEFKTGSLRLDEQHIVRDLQELGIVHFSKNILNDLKNENEKKEYIELICL